MKSKTLKNLLHFGISVGICFVLIYLFVLVGGWKLMESNDPILLELAASIAMGFVFWVMYEIAKVYETRLKELEKRIEELEK